MKKAVQQIIPGTGNMDLDGMKETTIASGIRAVVPRSGKPQKLDR